MVFLWCTEWSVGDGNSISFWFDSWMGIPVHTSNRDMPLQYLSLREAWPTRHLLDQDRIFPDELTFSGDQDMIVWRWETSGVYTAKSVYRMLSGGGLIKWHFQYTWKSKVPPSAKLFAYFMLHGKILTREVLRRRGMHLGMHCALCQDCPVESIVHVLFLCPYAVTVWFNVALLLDRPIFQIAGTVHQIWEASWAKVQQQGGMSKQDWCSRFICVAWSIWKQRNMVIFRDEYIDAKFVAVKAVQEMSLWKKYC